VKNNKGVQTQHLNAKINYLRTMPEAAKSLKSFIPENAKGDYADGYELA
jgi:hypothetical protein